MSKYFVNEYKNYYDIISSNNDIEINYNNLVNKIATLNSSLNNYTNYIENTNWNEKGKMELLYSYIPIIKKNSLVLEKYVIYDLNKVILLVKKDLFDLLSSLKEKDEEYCKIEEKLLNDEKEETLEKDIEVLKENIKEIIKNIDDKILEIKNYDILSSNEDNTLLIDTTELDKSLNDFLEIYKNSNDGTIDDSIINRLISQLEYKKSTNYLNGNRSELDNNNCIDLAYLGNNWKVVNTSIPVTDYATIAYNKGIRQNSNSQRYSDLCLAFSYVHASNMYNGSTYDNAESAYNWKHASEFTDYFSDSKQETLKTVFNQIKEGKPVVMQVNGNKAGTSRHFVTVVGVKSNVKNASEIKESDLLIIDSWDGKLETMDTSSSRFMTTGADCNKSYSGYYLRILK